MQKSVHQRALVKRNIFPSQSYLLSATSLAHVQANMTQDQANLSSCTHAHIWIEHQPPDPSNKQDLTTHLLTGGDNQNMLQLLAVTEFLQDLYNEVHLLQLFFLGSRNGIKQISTA